MNRTIWTDFAHSYDRVVRHWDPYRALIDKARHHLGLARRVLDQGCGTGLVAAGLASMGIEVDGIDTNAEMLAVARRRALDTVGMRILEADAEQVPFADATFDGLVSHNVIFYVTDPARLLSEARRVLAPGGVMTICGPQPDPDLALLGRMTTAEFERKGLLDVLRDDFEHFKQCSQTLKRDGMPNVYRLQEIVGLLRAHGFTTVLESDDTLYYGQSWFVAVR